MNEERRTPLLVCNRKYMFFLKELTSKENDNLLPKIYKALELNLFYSNDTYFNNIFEDWCFCCEDVKSIVTTTLINNLEKASVIGSKDITKATINKWYGTVEARKQRDKNLFSKIQRFSLCHFGG